MMDTAQAKAILEYRDQQSTYKPNLSASQLDLRAATFAAALEGADPAWVMDLVLERAVDGRPPTDAQIIAAWREHRTPERDAVLEALQTPMPTAPQAVQDDPARWLRWERARRAAISNGATPAEAVEAANAAVGAAPDDEAAPVDVERLRGQIRRLGAARRVETEGVA